MNIYIKDMASGHCKTAVKEELRKLGLQYSNVDIGVIKTERDFTALQLADLQQLLLRSGIQVLQHQHMILVARIKNEIVNVMYANEISRIDFSIFLPEMLQHDYDYLAQLFSDVTETSIERFIMDHKIERAKELIVYNGLDLSEICRLLNFNSVIQLSRELKKVTGLSATHFKKVRQARAARLYPGK